MQIYNLKMQKSIGGVKYLHKKTGITPGISIVSLWCGLGNGSEPLWNHFDYFAVYGDCVLCCTYLHPVKTSLPL